MKDKGKLLEQFCIVYLAHLCTMIRTRGQSYRFRFCDLSVRITSIAARYGLLLSWRSVVCLSCSRLCGFSPAKTAETVEMPNEPYIRCAGHVLHLVNLIEWFVLRGAAGCHYLLCSNLFVFLYLGWFACVGSVFVKFVSEYFVCLFVIVSLKISIQLTSSKNCLWNEMFKRIANFK